MDKFSGELIRVTFTDMVFFSRLPSLRLVCPPMLIDSHHHLWKYSALEYGWMQDQMAVLKRDYLAKELREIASQSGVDGFVTVQARQKLIENDDLMAIAKEEPLIWGVVGWVPLADKKVGEVLDRYAANPLFRGVRHVVQDEPDDCFILGADFNRGVAEIASRNLVYDILIFAKHLPVSIEFVDRHPSQSMVVDHIAKPRLHSDAFDVLWEKQFRDLAKRENVMCKFSGVVTEVRDEAWTIDSIRRYWDVAIDAYSPKRLMFGSDWPVCLLKSSHHKWVETAQKLASELSPDEQADLFANTAIKAYSLAKR